MEAIAQRLFGSAKKTAPPPRESAASEQSFEQIHRAKAKLDAFYDNLVRLREKSHFAARNQRRLKLKQAAELSFKDCQRKEVLITHNRLMAEKLEELIDAIRATETSSMTLDAFQRVSAYLQETLNNVRLDDVDKLMDDLQAQQREAGDIQKTLSKQRRGLFTSALNEVDLSREFENFYNEEEEEEEEETAAGTAVDGASEDKTRVKELA